MRNPSVSARLKIDKTIPARPSLDRSVSARLNFAEYDNHILL
jgi:hypothetical protein